MGLKKQKVTSICLKDGINRLENEEMTDSEFPSRLSSSFVTTRKCNREEYMNLEALHRYNEVSTNT